jgi:hypothetical protein
LLRKPEPGNYKLYLKELDPKKKEEKFLRKLLNMTPLLNNSLRFIISSFIKMASFMDMHFSYEISTTNLRKTKIKDFLVDISNSENSQENIHSSDNQEWKFGEEDKLKLKNENIMRTFAKNYENYKIAFEKLRKIVKEIKKKYRKLYKLDEIEFPSEKDLDRKEVLLSSLVLSDYDFELTHLNKNLKILCDIQNSLLREKKEFSQDPMTNLNVRKFDELGEMQILDLDVDYLDRMIAQNSVSNYKLENQKQVEYNFKRIFSLILKKTFMEQNILDIVNLPKFKFNDIIYSEKYYLKLLTKKYGSLSPSELIRKDYFEKSRTQSNDFKDFNSVKRVIYFVLNYDEEDKELTVGEFLQKNNIQIENISRIESQKLKYLYSYYCFLEFRLIQLNISQISNRLCDSNPMKKSTELRKFFEKYKNKELKLKLEERKRIKMSYLEIWITAVIRVISRFFIVGLDKDDLLVNTFKKSYNIYPEDFNHNDVAEKFEAKLRTLEIKNKFMVQVYEILRKVCDENLT